MRTTPVPSLPRATGAAPRLGRRRLDDDVVAAALDVADREPALARGFPELGGAAEVSGREEHDHPDPHVEDAVHLLKRDIAFAPR